VAILDQDPRAPVSVIVPAYQAAAIIGRALHSVARQTRQPAEVILVDDGSTDATAAAAEACAAAMPAVNLRVIRQPNRGAGAARNRALAEARGDYVAFLDADDEWLPEKLDQSLVRLEASGLALIAHNGWIVEDGRETYLDIAARYRAAAGRLFEGLYRRGFLSTSSVVARRESIVAAGGFDETLRNGHDFDLWLKVLADPRNTFEVFDMPLTRYHITRGSITTHTRRRLLNTIEIAIRHAPMLRIHNGSPLASLLFRIAAVHHEAAQAYWARGNIAGALAVVLGYPVRTVGAAARYLAARTR
jgi:glycosyltransferase involved in cell wall biosynthesis